MERLAALALCLFLLPAAPQSKPDFSGTWVLDVKRSSGGTAPESRLSPQTLVVKQTPTELSFEIRSPGEPPTTEVFRLDRERRSGTPADWNARQAHFVGNELVLTYQSGARDLVRTTTVDWSLSADRRVLTVSGTATRERRQRTGELVTSELKVKLVYQRQ